MVSTWKLPSRDRRERVRQIEPSGDTFERAESAVRALVYPSVLPYNASVRKRQTLYIKNPEAHRLASRLSRRMGVTITDAVIHALGEQVRRKGPGIDRKKIDAVCKELASLPVLDSRSPEEILGYDELGLPR